MKTRMGQRKESNYDLAIPSATSATELEDLPSPRQDGNSYLNNFESYMSHFDNYVSRQQMLKGYSPSISSLPQIGDIPKSNYSQQNSQSQSQGLASNQNGNYSGDLIAFKPSVTSTGNPVEDSGWFSNLYNVSGSLGAGANSAASAGTASTTSGIAGINNGIVENTSYGNTSHNVANPGLNFDNVVNSAYDGTSVKLSDFVRLTEAIQELICRLPRPPTEELLRTLEPKLAFTLHMTYLKAYIYNQQLLQEIKNSFIGMFTGGVGGAATDASKGSVRNYFSPNAIPNVRANAPVPMVGYDYGMYNGNVGGANIGSTTSNYGFVGSSTPSITGNGGAMPLENSSAYMPNYASYFNQQYPPPLASHAHLQGPLPLGMEPSSRQSSSVGDDASGNILLDPRFDAALNDRGHPAAAIPQDLKATVKYDARKHAYVAVMVGPLGGRRRRAFSIRKFGKDRALKLAAKYAISSGAKVAIKERGLFEHVCEYALSLNPNSGTKLDYIAEAKALPETRGVVFSCGAQLWLAITYDSDATRFIKGFSVAEYGFHGAHERALQHLNEDIQKHGLVASKLSGILCFWLERDAKGDKVLCVLLQAAEMRRGTGNENYIGRFPLAANASFNATKLAAQKWRSELKKQPYQQQNNESSDGTLENEDDYYEQEEEEEDDNYSMVKSGAYRGH